MATRAYYTLPTLETVLFTNDYKTYLRSVKFYVSADEQVLDTLEPPMSEFAKEKRLYQLLLDYMCYTYKKPTVAQSLMVPLILDGFDMIATHSFRSGKMVGYLLAISNMIIKGPPKGFCVDGQCRHFPLALILVPEHIMAKRIVKISHQISNGSMAMVSCTMPSDYPYDEYQKSDKLGDIFVTTLGRLINDKNQGKISLKEVRIMVMPAINRIIQKQAADLECIFGMLPKGVQKVMVDSEYSEYIEMFADNWMKKNRVLLNLADKNDVAFFRRKDIIQEFKFFNKPKTFTEKLEYIANELEKRGEGTLIFVNEFEHLHKVYGRLVFPADVISEEMSDVSRECALEEFREGRLRALVVHSHLARFLDYPGVNIVVNFDPPTLEEYKFRLSLLICYEKIPKYKNKTLRMITMYLKDVDTPMAEDLKEVFDLGNFDVPNWLYEESSLSKDRRRRRVRGYQRDQDEFCEPFY